MRPQLNRGQTYTLVVRVVGSEEVALGSAHIMGGALESKDVEGVMEGAIPEMAGSVLEREGNPC